MKTIAFISRKGGSGKTSLAIHLAVAFEGCGVSTSIIDLDPQRSAWKWGDARGKGNFPDVYAPRLDQLASFMDDLKANDVKLVVIDTPPHSDERALAGIRLAGLVLVPFRASILDVEALEDSVRLIQAAGKSDQAVLVMNAAAAKGLVAEALEAVAEFGLPVCPVTVGDRASLNHALTDAKGVTEYEAKGKAADDITALRKFAAKRLRIKKGSV